MVVFLTVVNLTTGEEGQCFAEATEIRSWFSSTIDKRAPGVPDFLRGKTLVCVGMSNGVQHFSAEEFHALSARILRARGETDLAQSEEKAAASLGSPSLVV